MVRPLPARVPLLPAARATGRSGRKRTLVLTLVPCTCDGPGLSSVPAARALTPRQKQERKRGSHLGSAHPWARCSVASVFPPVPPRPGTIAQATPGRTIGPSATAPETEQGSGAPLAKADCDGRQEEWDFGSNLYISFFSVMERMEAPWRKSGEERIQGKSITYNSETMTADPEAGSLQLARLFPTSVQRKQFCVL